MLNVRKNYFCSFQELSNVNLSDLSFYFCIKYIINLQNIVKFVQCPLKNVKRTHTHTHTHTHHWIKSPSVIAILTKINAEFLDRHHYFNFYIKIQLMCLPLSNYGWLNQGLISYIKKKKKKKFSLFSPPLCSYNMWVLFWNVRKSIFKRFENRLENKFSMPDKRYFLETIFMIRKLIEMIEITNLKSKNYTSIQNQCYK